MAMISLLYEVEFRVKVPTSPGEIVCITGNIPALGGWDPHKAIKLKRETSKRPTSASSSPVRSERETSRQSQSLLSLPGQEDARTVQQG